MSSTPASALLATLIAPTAATESALPVSAGGAPLDTAFSRLFDAEAAAAETIESAVAVATPSNENPPLPVSVASDSAMPEALILVQLLLSNQVANSAPPPTLKSAEWPVSDIEDDVSLETGIPAEASEGIETTGTNAAKVAVQTVVEGSEIEPQSPPDSPKAFAPQITASDSNEIVVSDSNTRMISQPHHAVRAESRSEVQGIQIPEYKKPDARTETNYTSSNPAPKLEVPEEAKTEAAKRAPATPQQSEAFVRTVQPVKETAPKSEPSLVAELLLPAKSDVSSRLESSEETNEACASEVPLDDLGESTLGFDGTLNDASFHSQPALPEVMTLGAAGVLNSPKAPQAFVTPIPDTVEESEQPLEAIAPREKNREQKFTLKDLVVAKLAPSDSQPEIRPGADAPQNDEIFSLPAPVAEPIQNKGKEGEASEERIRLVSDRGAPPAKTPQLTETLVLRAAPKSALVQQLDAVETAFESQRATPVSDAQKVSANSQITTEFPREADEKKSVESLPAKALERSAANLLNRGHDAEISRRQTSLEGFSYSARQDENTASASPVLLLDGGRPETIASQNSSRVSESATPVRAEKLLSELTTSIPNPYRVTTFEIKPEGMGPVRVKITTRGEGENAIWKVQIQTSDPAARSLLSEHLNELRERMPAAENVKVELAAPSASDARNETNRQEQGSNRERNEGRANREEAQRQSDQRRRGGNFLEWLAERE